MARGLQLPAMEPMMACILGVEGRISGARRKAYRCPLREGLVCCLNGSGHLCGRALVVGREKGRAKKDVSIRHEY